MSTTGIEPYYRALGDNRYESTVHAQGAWNPHEQHMAPVSGILAHCLEQFQPRPELRMARLSFDILGLIPDGEFTVVTSMLRPGRTIELIQAELVSGGRTAVRASAWRLQRSDTSAVAAIEDAPMAGPEEASDPVALDDWPGGYIKSVEVRDARRAPPGPRSRLDPHRTSAGRRGAASFVRLIGLIDTSNGVATRVRPGVGSYLFPNVDLQIHLYREPDGEWLGLENSVSFGAEGIGLTSTVLHDLTGPFGRAEQILTLRKS